ncbi:thiol:disulfide interchange protein DsbA/DsbL [Kangiella sediminilitoris]|uniref:Thiol:disulfide interchange protein DsbA n=1 Tax=Kangiella sediminilitoris TaxID=1144748 RepID=A0A1B3BE85_9GAMM|nr:thiol:disulfide interchange protein DsbA/DsbL [Kangiella sediminilitoris]AOE51017.1 Thiol:disulfide interchange protein [Kangiella sediminilitoris]
MTLTNKLFATLMTLSLALTGCSENDEEQKKDKVTLEAPVYSVKEGVDYTVIAGKEATKEPVVYEFFSYTCPHCYNLEPLMVRWKENDKPDAVTFEQIPVFMAQVSHLTYGYYTAEELKVKDKVHPLIFDEWHRKKNIIRNKEGLIPIFKQVGVSKEEFEAAYNSAAVQAKVDRARQMMREFSIMSFPQLIVNEKFKVTSYENINEMLGTFAIGNTQ